MATDFYNECPYFDKVRPAKHKEWTVLAAFISEDVSIQEFKVVALATGTKSLGCSLMSKDGFLINDCHAEVLAKRSLVKYLYE